MVSEKKICFSTNLIYFCVIAAFVLVRACSNHFSFLGPYGGYILSISTQLFLIFLIPFISYKCANKQKAIETARDFSFKKISKKSIIVSIVLGFVVFFVNIYISTFFNSAIQFFGYKPSPATPSELPATWWVFALNLLSTAILPAIAEETLHRGMLLRGNSMLGINKSILVSGVLFGLLHLNIEQFFYAAIIGVFLGYLCVSCSSIWPCIIVHFMNNATSVFLSFARSRGWAIGSFLTVATDFVFQNAFIGILLAFLILVLLLYIAYQLFKVLVKDSFNYNFVNKQKDIARLAVRESFFEQVGQIKAEQNVDENIYDSNAQTVYMDFDDFLRFVDQNMDKILKKAQEEEDRQNKHKMQTKSKIFLVASFVLTAVVTLMTFIWGLF